MTRSQSPISPIRSHPLAVAVCLLGFVSLVVGFSVAPAAPETNAPSPETNAPSPITDGLAQSQGQTAYESNCASCHGDDGQAYTRMGERLGVPPFVAPRLDGLGQDGLRQAIVSGHDRPVADGLSDDEVQAIVDYVLSMPVPGWRPGSDTES